MALGGTSALYDKLYSHQFGVSTADPVQLDTEGNEIQLNNRYWVVDENDGEHLIYNDPIDIDNFTDHDELSYADSVKTLLKLYPDSKLKRYVGDDIYREVKPMTGLNQSYGDENHYVATVPFNITNVDGLIDALNDMQAWHEKISDKLTDDEDSRYYDIWNQLATWKPELEAEK